MFSLYANGTNLQYAIDFGGGLCSSTMSNTSGRTPSELREWLVALEKYSSRGTRVSVLDFETICDCYYRIDVALKQEHKIVMPYAIMQKAIQEKMRWYINHIDALISQA